MANLSNIKAKSKAKGRPEKLQMQTLAQCVAKLEELRKSAKHNEWAEGEVIASLYDLHDLTFPQIADKFGYEGKQQVQILYQMAKQIPPNLRNIRTAKGKTLPKSGHENAIRAVGRCARKGLVIPIEQAIKVVAENNLTDRTQAIIHFNNLVDRSNDVKAVAHAPLLIASSHEIINRCHHSDCRLMIDKFSDRSVKLFWLDPVYWGYRKNRKSGVYPMQDVSKAVRNTADNLDAPKSIAIVVDLLATMPRKLAKGGIVLLWSSATTLPASIQLALVEHGWIAFPPVVVWDKRKANMLGQDTPWFSNTEFCYMLWQSKDTVFRHDNGNRDNVIEFEPELIPLPPMTHNVTTPMATHAFQKPESLAEVFISRHTSKGEVVADLFGCSGSACIAANRLGRNWVYCESHQGNFEWGAQRIADTLAKEKQSA